MKNLSFDSKDPGRNRRIVQNTFARMKRPRKIGLPETFTAFEIVPVLEDRIRFRVLSDFIASSGPSEDGI